MSLNLEHPASIGALRIIAHCGACTERPENTMAAFRRAIDEGADMIEHDLRLTRDGHIVVFHDATTYRLAGAGGRIAALTLEELRSLKVDGTERIPLLAETLELPVPFIHELKVGGIEAALVAAIDGRPDDIVSSFDHGVLDRVRAINPAVRIGYLWFGDDWQSVVAKAGGHGAHSVHPSNHDVCPEMVTSAHALGLEVYVWTVGDALRARQLASWGVDGVMTYTPRATRDAYAASVGQGQRRVPHKH